MILPKMNFKTYAALNSVNASRLKLMERSPYHYKNVSYPDSKSLLLGLVTHTLVLEPHMFHKEYVVAEGATVSDEEIEMFKNNPFVYEGKVKRGKAFESFLVENNTTADQVMTSDKYEKIKDYLAFADGKEMITQSLLDSAKNMVDAVYENPFAVRILEHHNVSFEQTRQWEYQGHSLKSRYDILIKDDDGYRVYDLKTTADSKSGSFPRSVSMFGYDFSAAFYSIEDADFKAKSFGFITTSKDSLPLSTVYHNIDPEIMKLARERVDECLSKLRNCLLLDEWPRPPMEYDFIDRNGGYDVGGEEEDYYGDEEWGR